jgi:hypothetical protein
VPPLNKQVNLTPIIKAGEFTMAIEDMIEISEESLQEKKDAFEVLLDKIPINAVSSKASAADKTNNSTKRKSPKADKIVIQPDTPVPVHIPAEEELKPIKSYNLLDLQMLARLHKIDTQKEGKAGKKVNKTKEEMYSEIKEKLGK